MEASDNEAPLLEEQAGVSRIKAIVAALGIIVWVWAWAYRGPS